jgi:hypothetical protein
LPLLTEIFAPSGGTIGIGELGLGLVMAAHASTAFRAMHC